MKNIEIPMSQKHYTFMKKKQKYEAIL